MSEGDAEQVSRRRVVVGVDNYSNAAPALEWAAAEAVLRGGELLIVHALDYGDSMHVAPVSLPVAEQVARQVLAQAAAFVSVGWSELPLATLLSHADPTEALIDASSDAGLLVMGNNGLKDLAVSMLGTVGRRVVTHAHCPVVIVPASPLRAEIAHNPRIVVGLAPTRAGRLALRTAVAEARLHGYAVTAVRANAAQANAGGAKAGRVDGGLHDGGSRDKVLDELANAVAIEAPDIVFEVVQHDSDAQQALFDASRRGCLLVIGCHHSDDPLSARLGSVPAALLGRLPVPVMLVGQLS